MVFVFSFWVMNSISSSSGVMYTWYSPETMREAVLPADFPAGCSVPVDGEWVSEVNSIKWVAYSSPNLKKNYRQPSAENIRKDLSILRKAGFTGLVTYGSSGIMGRDFPSIAQSLGFRGVILGIWNPLNENELANAKNAASLPVVLGYYVGNEGLFGSRERYAIRDLCSAIADLRTSSGKPVTTSEEIDDYSLHTELLFIGDWLFPNAHPYWHSTKYPSDAVKWETLRYRDMVENTRRFVLFKEVGLPTSGAAGLSEGSHDRFYRDLAKSDVRFVYFEGFDQPSKNSSPVESNWGIFDALRQPKLLGWNLMGYRWFTSDGVYEGTILGCRETGGEGCPSALNTATLLVGGDATNRPYHALLSFNTAGLPDDAGITSARLKIRVESVTGGNPFDKRRRLVVDSCRSSWAAVKFSPIEFKGPEDCLFAGEFERQPRNGWYIARLIPAAYSGIDLEGRTMFRLRYSRGENDGGADYVKIYGGAASEPSRPILVIGYTIP
jgi:exo-beta-1,3-glucanase (GH17 family)